MAIVKERYSATRVDKIYQLLKNEAENGSAKEYDVKVDELKVVSRTNDPERFYSHEDFVLAETQSISINIYDGGSHRCTRYHLMLKEEEQPQELSGIEKAINTRMNQERTKWEYERLKKENEDLRQRLHECEDYQNRLEDRITTLAEENTKLSSKDRLTETLVSFAGMYLAKNPNALNGIPIIGSILGGNEQQEPVGEATFTRVEKSDRQADQPNQGRKDRQFTGNIKGADEEGLQLALIPFFKEEHLEAVEDIIYGLHYHNSLIPQVLQRMEDAVNRGKEQNKAA